MTISVDVKVDINVPKIMAIIDGDKFWTFAASEWHRLYSPFVPMQTGNLMKDVTVKPKTIVHNAPYARRQYNGDFNFRTTGEGGHEKACKEWDKAAIPSQGPILISSLQAYIDSGRLWR